jgi:hypothetical protein
MNELVINGEDVDYGVIPDRLVTIDTPPYFASQIGLTLWLL